MNIEEFSLKKSIKPLSEFATEEQAPSEVEPRDGTIVLVAGGTGGHLFPAIATAEELTSRGYDLHLITDKRCEKYLSEDINFKNYIIDLRMNNTNLLTRVVFLFSILRAFYESVLLLRKLKPKLIIGFGGYPSFPPMLASVILRIPIILHEQNSFMGKVNKFFLKFAKKVALSYKDTKNIDILYQKKTSLVGNIVRKNIRDLKVKREFDNEIFRILIFGGSQGAKIFSSLLPNAIKILLKSNPNIKMHITQQISKDDIEAVAQIYDNLKVTHSLSEFFTNIEEQYKNTDLVISRSGATTISELSYIGMPSILIPYPYASDNHQFYNAMSLAKKSCAWCFTQNEISASILAKKILLLINNRDLLKQTSVNLLQIKCDANKLLADMAEQIIIHLEK